MKKDRLIYVRNAAERLCCTEAHVYQMIADGKLSAVRLGPRALRVFEKSVDEFIRQHKINAEDYLSDPLQESGR